MDIDRQQNIPKGAKAPQATDILLYNQEANKLKWVRAYAYQSQQKSQHANKPSQQPVL
mgnify:CR=1 FL=1